MMDLNLLTSKIHQRTYKAGERIYGVDGAIEMYIIISGKVSLFAISPDRKLLSGGTSGPGETLGEVGFFTGTDRMVYQAAEDTRVFVLTDQTFDRIISTRPQLAFALLQQAYGGSGSDDVRSIFDERQERLRQMEKEEQDKQEQTPPSQLPEDMQVDEGDINVKDDNILPSQHRGYPGITHPEYKKFLYDMDYTCPNCKHGFKGSRVFLSKLVPKGSIRYDMRQLYHDFSKPWYDIITCPECYFSMFEEYYLESHALNRPRIKESLTLAISKLGLNFEEERTLDHVFKTHYIALLCADGYRNRLQLNMRLWSNISWLYEDVGDESMEVYAALKAADSYEEVYIHTNATGAQEQMLAMAVAGMLYRGGAQKGLMKWLYTAKTVEGGSRVYRQMADDLTEKARRKQEED